MIGSHCFSQELPIEDHFSGCRLSMTCDLLTCRTTLLCGLGSPQVTANRTCRCDQSVVCIAVRIAATVAVVLYSFIYFHSGSSVLAKRAPPVNQLSRLLPIWAQSFSPFSMVSSTAPTHHFCMQHGDSSIFFHTHTFMHMIQLHS